jgi:hypothetical protein
MTLVLNVKNFISIAARVFVLVSLAQRIVFLLRNLDADLGQPSLYCIWL